MGAFPAVPLSTSQRLSDPALGNSVPFSAFQNLIFFYYTLLTPICQAFFITCRATTLKGLKEYGSLSEESSAKTFNRQDACLPLKNRLLRR